MSSEQRQPPPAGSANWQDQIELLAVSHDHRLALATRLTYFHQSGPACLQICVWIEGQEPIVLCESDLAIPGRLWEVRGSGLWADHICETPMLHWSYGLEAFALSIDNPAELLGRGLGERVPIGWELEFEASVEPEGAGAVPPTKESPQGHSQPGAVHGLILTASGEYSFDGAGSRARRWGQAACLSPPQGEASLPSESEVALPGPGHVWWVDHRNGVVRQRAAEVAD